MVKDVSVPRAMRLARGVRGSTGGIVPLVILLLLAALTIGCGHSSQDSATQPAATKAPQANGDVPGSSTDAVRRVRVAAASDLQFALPEIVARFETAHPDCQVELVFGSSGTLFAQLSNKAPFDLFLSADMSYPRKLVEAGLADADSEFLYAIGHIVVWVPNSSPLDPQKLEIGTLTDPAVKKIAIANPQHAPYGRVAEAALKNMGAYDAVRDKLVLGENIAQTAQFVESGAADVGIIALSLALAPAMKDQGRYWPIPAENYPRLEQGGVIISSSAGAANARELRSYLMSDDAKSILRQYGFAVPGE